jgi:hypothetical protein
MRAWVLAGYHFLHFSTVRTEHVESPSSKAQNSAKYKRQDYRSRMCETPFHEHFDATLIPASGWQSLRRRLGVKQISNHVRTFSEQNEFLER